MAEEITLCHRGRHLRACQYCKRHAVCSFLLGLFLSVHDGCEFHLFSSAVADRFRCAGPSSMLMAPDSRSQHRHHLCTALVAAAPTVSFRASNQLVDGKCVKDTPKGQLFAPDTASLPCTVSICSGVHMLTAALQCNGAVSTGNANWLWPV